MPVMELIEPAHAPFMPQVGYGTVQEILRTEKIILFGGAFNPPGRHHARIAQELSNACDALIVIPCGMRTDKASTYLISREHRKELVRLGFAGCDKTEIDAFDLDYDMYTSTYRLQQVYERDYPGADIWHAVGADLVRGGADGQSEIQQKWFRGSEIWRTLNFFVIRYDERGIPQKDLPPHSQTLMVTGLNGRSTDIRNRIAQGESFGNLVLPDVEAYIREHRLYGYNSGR